MLVNYLWTAGGEISKPFLEALAEIAPTEETNVFVDDLLALVQELENQGLGRQAIADRVIRELNTGLAEELSSSAGEPDKIIKYLWDASGEVSSDFADVLAEFAPQDFRNEFAGDLIELMQDLESNSVSRRQIANRVIREVQEGMRSRMEEHGE